MRFYPLCVSTSNRTVSFEQSILNINEALKPVDDLCYQYKKKYLRLTVYAFYPLLLYVLRFTLFTGARGEMPTRKMQGKVRGLTPQFICTYTPWPHDDHKTGDTWAWDNRHYVMKHQLRFSEVHKVT